VPQNSSRILKAEETMPELTRRTMMAVVTAEKMPISAYHYAFPVTGCAEKDGTCYRPVRVNWNSAS
jgi:hypothetical protein